MAKMMQLEIVTPDRSLLLRDDVTYVLAEALDGGIGIFANHAPLISTLKAAPLKYRDAQGVEHFASLDVGFMEVGQNKVTILSAKAELAENIDVARAEAAKERAEKRLANPTVDSDIVRAEAALNRALSRLKTYKLSKTK